MNNDVKPARRPGRREAPRRPSLAGILLLALALASALAFSGCGPRRHRRDATKPPVIGFSLDSLVVERWQRDIAIFTKAAKDLGAELILRVADQDAGVQESQVKELVDLGIDVLVIVPNDADKLSSVVQAVKAKGIPVLSYDRLVRKAGVDLYVSFDNEKVGSLMSGALVKAVPAGGYIIINGAKSDNNANLINRGIHSVIDPEAASGRIHVISEIWPSSWDSEEVKVDLEAVLARDRGVEAVIAGNDMLAEAAINVLTENGLIRGVRVSGQDAELSACQRIAEGTQYATIYKPIDRLALKAAAFAVMLAKGEKIETDATIDDGLVKVPYVRLDPILVTRELLDSTVIKDGFHLKTDVYRNVGR
jgi:D-xylose transport system substrate-binding protein